MPAARASAPVSFLADGFRVAADCLPAEDAAGDFFALSSPAPGRLTVLVSDACGRGREGAAILRGIVPELRFLVRTGESPSRVLARLNDAALDKLPIDRFMTALVVEFDANQRRLTAANAGHVPALRRSAHHHVELLGTHAGPPLGVVRGAAYFLEEVECRSGDVVVMMTDGVLEALERDLLSMHRLRSLVAHGPPSATDLERVLLAALERRLHGRRPDDLTLVTVEVNPAVRGRGRHLERTRFAADEPLRCCGGAARR
ncbi:MAG: PP2C family protein-serine/threonine phosphatase [Polyangiaceae bacterium]